MFYADCMRGHCDLVDVARDNNERRHRQHMRIGPSGANMASSSASDASAAAAAAAMERVNTAPACIGRLINDNVQSQTQLASIHDLRHLCTYARLLSRLEPAQYTHRVAYSRLHSTPNETSFGTPRRS